MRHYSAKMAEMRILILVYDGFELLDLAGPASVFNGANLVTQQSVYRVVPVSQLGGSVRSMSGVEIISLPFDQIEVSGTDTVLVVGAEKSVVPQALQAAGMLEWLRTACPSAKRFGSVCTGSFLLAAAGLLDGREAATHWEACAQFAEMFPTVRVDPQSIYVESGKVWTSAGVTAGIDMSLAMVARDHGLPVRNRIARHLVILSHRSGNQAQFSSILDAQSAGCGRFDDLIGWLTSNCGKKLTIRDMAEYCGMSERSFSRKFRTSTGVSPGVFFERLRLDQSKSLMEQGKSVKEAAAAVGYGSTSGFRAAFAANFGMSPADYRLLHGKDRDLSQAV